MYTQTHHTILAVASSLLLAAGARAQTTWVVDAAGGPGSHFTDLTSAVNAAQPNDLILVRSGIYAGTTITKPLKIMSSESPSLSSPIVISGIPANTQCIVQRFRPIVPGPAEVRILDCDGHVHIEGYIGSLQERPRAIIRRSRHVTMLNCNYCQVDIEDSNLVFTLGQAGNAILAPNGLTPIVAKRSQVSLVETTVRSVNNCPSPLPAIDMRDTDLLVLGSLSQINGGGGYCAPTVDIRAHGGSITYDPALRTPSIAGNPYFTLRAVPGNSTYASLPNPTRGWPHLANVRVRGPAGATAITLASAPPLGPRPFQGVTGPNGPHAFGGDPWPALWIDPAAFVVANTQVLPPGRGTLTRVPTSQLVPPACKNLPLVFQSVILPRTGIPQLSTASVTVINVETP